MSDIDILDAIEGFLEDERRRNFFNAVNTKHQSKEIILNDSGVVYGDLVYPTSKDEREQELRLLAFLSSLEADEFYLYQEGGLGEIYKKRLKI